MAAQPSGVQITSPTFVSSAKFLRSHSNPSSKSLKKMLKSIGPRTDPWDILLAIASNGTLCHWSYPSGPSCSVVQLDLNHLTVHLNLSLLVCPWWCYARHCQRLFWSQAKHYLLLCPHPSSYSHNCRCLSSWSSM